MRESADIEFARLFDEHFAALTFYASQFSGDGQDLVQEAFLKLAEQYPGPERPVAWLYRVVRNLGLNEVRRQTRQQKHHHDWARQRQGAGPLSSPGMSAESAAENSELQTAVNRLPADVRVIVIARIWSGLTFQEIADLTGRSLATCQRHYQQALEQLRRQWADHPPIEESSKS